MPPDPTIDRDGRSAVVHLHGDLVVPAARALYARLRSVAKRRDVRTLVLDFADAGRIDSSGIAVVSLIGRQLAETGKQLDLSHMQDQHRAALTLAPGRAEEPGAPRITDGRKLDPAPRATDGRKPDPAPRATDGRMTDAARPEAGDAGDAHDAGDADDVGGPRTLEHLGEQVFGFGAGLRGFSHLLADTVVQLARVATRRTRLPPGSLWHHIEGMGVGAIFIVGLLSFLTGMTMAFQGAVQLQRFGAGVFVADMIGVSMVRELVPLMTAVIITGRTGAAIAAELGTMQVRSEIDALSTMGISPVRFLILPRLLAITVIGPALTLIGTFIGILGGMVVAAVRLDMPPVTFWSRVVDRVTLSDFVHGLGKSLVFAWIIGLAGSHLGMRARGDASSVGTATTRTVVVSVFFIILVDAMFATITTYTRFG
ncbi:MAG TPA: ABC transporter permease [Kofleriaceae bacterium]|nr:ABC transporter permease [Kofleriaceae bacterium]